jgi:predicted DsbA family dithiol-disulfide isomerase
MKFEIYSDVACPWCLIGKQRFERALATFPSAGRVEVVYQPYQLDPGAPRVGVPSREYLAARFGPGMAAKLEPVARAARDEGVTIDFDRALAANTLPAHRLMYLAEREGGPVLQRELVGLLFEANFSRGSDMGNTEVLVGLAAEAGLDPGRARAFLGSGEREEEVESRLRHGRSLGILAVPTFVFEARFAVQGAQASSTFLQALEAVAREIGDQRAAGAETAGDCADGSCAA